MPHNLITLQNGNKIEVVISSSIPCGDRLSRKSKELNIDVKGKYSAENFEILMYTNINISWICFQTNYTKTREDKIYQTQFYNAYFINSYNIWQFSQWNNVITQSKKSHNILLNRKENSNLEDNLSSSFAWVQATQKKIMTQNLPWKILG